MTDLFVAPDWQSIPMNLRAEAAVLGALLHSNRTIEHCAGLKPEHFAGEGHGALFAAIVDGIGAGHVVDGVSLAGRFSSVLLADSMVSMVGLHIADYARLVRETAEARELIAIAEEIAIAARSGAPPATIAAMATRQIDLLTMGTAVSQQCSLGESMAAALVAMECARSGKTAGLSTGFRCIDIRLGGLEPGLVYVLAGRPGMGKSAIAHQIGVNVARQDIGVLELSLEMSSTQLGRRTLVTAARVPLARLKDGTASVQECERLVRAEKELQNLPLTIDDTSGQTAAQIATKARVAKHRHGLGLVMIDHLNLVAAEPNDARHGPTWAVERASGTCLQIAKECQCPVLLLAQLNRGVEGREDKRPTLADLRQAGAIEQDAYAVGFVYRQAYYDKQTAKETPNEGEKATSRQNPALCSDESAAELIWKKVRDGEPGIDRLQFDGPTASFWEDRP